MSCSLPEPQHYPMPMKRFGVTPFGDALFRVVFAPSVRKIVGGKFADGFIGYRSRPAYKDLGPVWIIEKWISAWDHTRMTEASYEQQYKDAETGLILTGPYPTRGIYMLCEALAGNPADGGIDKLITLLLKAKKNDPAANQKALLDNMEKQEKADQAARFDRCKEMLPAYGVRAASFRGHVKATKTAPLVLTAQEAGLHTRGVKFGGNKRHAL